ncbi:MAG: hypothetical protein M3R61_17955, partial [Chloroflexota bacterium]|nr:hypothetical protein [Chloroflexota bacterium]
MLTANDPIPTACRRLCALAERDPRRAVALARHAHAALHASDPATVAWANYTLGWALLRWERTSEARPYLDAAYTAFVLQEAHIAALRCRYALLLADQMQLSRANLDQEFALLAEQFVSAGALPNAVEATLDHARQLNMLGRSQEAVEALDRAAPIIAEGTSFDLARMLRIRGVAANGQGDFPGAQRLLSEAEQAFSTLKQPIEVAKCWLEQA